MARAHQTGSHPGTQYHWQHPHTFAGAVLLPHPGGGVVVAARNAHGQFSHGYWFPSVAHAHAWVNSHHAGIVRHHVKRGGRR